MYNLGRRRRGRGRRGEDEFLQCVDGLCVGLYRGVRGTCLIATATDVATAATGWLDVHEPPLDGPSQLHELARELREFLRVALRQRLQFARGVCRHGEKG